jgi:hypothetical protein
MTIVTAKSPIALDLANPVTSPYPENPEDADAPFL